MSLIPFSLFPRSSFDMDFWVNPISNMHSTLGLFGSFDELDHLMVRNMRRLNKPMFMNPLMIGLARVPQKYRISIDCPGFRSSSIKTEIRENILYVNGREEEKESEDDYSTKEFKKKYVLPEECETDKLVSFMITPGHLVIEMPLKEKERHMNIDLFPKIVQDKDGKSKVSLDFHMPQEIEPEKINIHVKDRDLIVKAEDHNESRDVKSKFYYYKRMTLPENTDFKNLNCVWNNNIISVNAPLMDKSSTIELKHEQL